MIIVANNIEQKSMRISKFNNKYIVEQYLQGRNTNDLAKELSTYNTTIRRILIKENIILRSSAEVWCKRTNPFLDLTSEQVQYWLGILATDGNISNTRICLQLSYKDSCLVNEFGIFTKAPVKNIYNKKYNLFERRCEFKDKFISQTLISYGITPKKSLTLDIKIPITWNFLRGVLDGDGYIRSFKKRATFEIATASEKFAFQLKNFLLENNIKVYKRNLNNLYIIGVYNKNDVFKCYTLMYNTATIFLKRKKDSFGPLISEMNKMQDLQIQRTLLGNSEPSL